VRLHGSETLYQSAYTDAELDRWAACVLAWRSGAQPADARLIASRPPPRRRARDVYLYFDNTDKLQAPLDAQRLMARLGLVGAAAQSPRPAAPRARARVRAGT
jgi:uncharacterized protein YecE (DUF72 family)